MDVLSIIDGINAKKVAMAITNQQIADASGIPKSTVDRVLGKRTDNPTITVILSIAQAVGYELGTPSSAQTPNLADENPHVRHIIAMYEKQISDMRRDHNLERTEKNRWIKMLAFIVAVLVTGIMFILIYDVTHHAMGWFQMDGLYEYRSALNSFSKWMA